MAALLFLAACAMPNGVAVEECNTSWRGIDALIATGATADQQTIPISCMRTVDEKRISIGFEMPPGPDCYELASIGLVESADAVSVTLNRLGHRRHRRILLAGAGPVRHRGRPPVAGRRPDAARREPMTAHTMNG